MTPVDGCFSLPETTVLDELTLQRILKCGHTRIGDDDEYVDDAKASTRKPGLVERNSKRYDPLALLRQLSREDPSERFDAPPSATLAPRPSLESRMSSI